jgi:hypothetical protein
MPTNKVIEIHKAMHPDKVLEMAMGQYDQVFIVGFDKDGEFDARSSTNMNYKDILWMLDVFRHKLLNGDYF